MPMPWHRTDSASWRQARGVLLLAAALAAPAAWAQSFTYTATGQVGAIPPTASAASRSAAEVQVFVLQGTYELSSYGQFSLFSNFAFDTGTGTGSGGFLMSQGANLLSGNLTATQAVVASQPGFEISYSFSGGDGALAGATGSGSGLIVLTGPSDVPPLSAYIEAGIMTLSVVPEPGSALLMLGGLAALLGRRALRAR